MFFFIIENNSYNNDNESDVEISEEENEVKNESRPIEEEKTCSKYSIKSFAEKTAELTMTVIFALI